MMAQSNSCNRLDSSMLHHHLENDLNDLPVNDLNSNVVVVVDAGVAYDSVENVN